MEEPKIRRDLFREADEADRAATRRALPGLLAALALFLLVVGLLHYFRL
jgi:hypothetical protein